MLHKFWGVVILALGACQSSSATVRLEAHPYVLEMTLVGTAAQLEAVAELRRAVDGAAVARRALERMRTPYTAWLSDGTMTLITSDLYRRHRTLSASDSRLVRVSLRADVDPAFGRLMTEFPKE